MINQSGYVYLLKNEAMPGIYKIGMTNRTVEERVKELSLSTSIPLPFEVVCSVEVDNAAEAEGELHEEFEEFRISKSREFFKFDNLKIKSVIDSFAGYAIAKMSDGEDALHEIYGGNLEDKLINIAMQNLNAEPMCFENADGDREYIMSSILLTLLKECSKRTNYRGEDNVYIPLVLYKFGTVKQYKDMLKKNMNQETLNLCIKNMDLEHDPFNLKELLEE